MHIKVKSFAFHKIAECYNDLYDRISINLDTNKFAISDGVTSSFLPDIWAKLIVETFTSENGRIDFKQPFDLNKVQKSWSMQAKGFINGESDNWFTRNLFEEGSSASATFVGLHLFYENNIPYWEAIAIGDSYLFFIPSEAYNKELGLENYIDSLPPENESAFNNFPDYIDSISKEPKGNYISRKIQELKAGVFYLMTDALAEWFFKNKLNAIEQINACNSQDDFIEFLTNLRDRGQINDDDTSILILELSDDTNLNFNYCKVETFDFANYRHPLN